MILPPGEYKRQAMQLLSSNGKERILDNNRESTKNLDRHQNQTTTSPVMNLYWVAHALAQKELT